MSQPWMSLIIHQPAEWTDELRAAAALKLEAWAREVPSWPNPEPGAPFTKRLDWFTIKGLP